MSIEVLFQGGHMVNLASAFVLLQFLHPLLQKIAAVQQMKNIVQMHHNWVKISLPEFRFTKKFDHLFVVKRKKTCTECYRITNCYFSSYFIYLRG